MNHEKQLAHTGAGSTSTGWRKLFVGLIGCVVSRNYLDFKAVRSGGNTSRAPKLHRFSRGRDSHRPLTRWRISNTLALENNPVLYL